MKVIVISNPTPINNEASLINQLFNEGLPCFHLRKPNASEKEIEILLNQIDEQFHSKIALHQHHQLASKFEIKSLHYPEHRRKQMTIEKLRNQKEKGFVLSTSIHQLESLNQIKSFDYSFYGPVFNSISKKEYQSIIAPDFQIEKQINNPQIIALGGITYENLHQIKQMNFDGFAVLGFIWERPEQAIHQFKKIKKHNHHD